MTKCWTRILDGMYLFNDDYVGPIDLPDNVINCDDMFAHCNIKEGCYLRDFDTSNVVSMVRMFYGATIPKGFSLGDNFNTENVERMQMMFAEASVTNDFTLGDKFKIKSRCNIRDMFKDCNTTKQLIDECERFDTIAYLKKLCGSDFDKLPKDKVEQCQTDVDCDNLYERWLFSQ